MTPSPRMTLTATAARDLADHIIDDIVLSWPTDKEAPEQMYKDVAFAIQDRLASQPAAEGLQHEPWCEAIKTPCPGKCDCGASPQEPREDMKS